MDISLRKVAGKVIRYFGRFFAEKYRDLRSAYYIRKKTKKKHDKNRKIRVAFIAQMPEVWDKEEPVYEAMIRDSRFKVQLIVVPPYNLVEKKVGIDYTNNYFMDKYTRAIKAYNNGRWIDLYGRYDYIFYQRPYDNYLPSTLRSDSVVKVAKCCYISYAYWLSSNMFCGYNKQFFRNIYYAFMESEEHAKVLQKNGRNEGRIIFRGYPELEYVQSYETTSVNHLLWTPRWSYDENLGGSHFFEYKDKILKMKEIFPDICLTIRPHPLAFDNYISKGLMTIEEKEKYLCEVKKANVCLDKNEKIMDTFDSTDVLITDISSIIVPFFLTGKPVIYCKSNITMSSVFEIFENGLYIAENWDQVISHYRAIAEGGDPLKDCRRRIAEKMRLENVNASSRILDTLHADWNS